MNYSDLRKEVRKLYRPAHVLDDAFSPWFRRVIEKVIFVIFSLNIVLSVYVFTMRDFPNVIPDTLKIIEFLQYEKEIYGLLLITFSLLIISTFFKFFYRSYYFLDIYFSRREVGLQKDAAPVSFETGLIVHNTNDADITFGFLNSSMGRKIMWRVGIPDSDVKSFLTGDRFLVSSDVFCIDTFEKIGLPLYAKNVFVKDSSFSQFLFSHGVVESDFIGAVEWIEERQKTARKNKRWWSRDALGRIPRFGKDFIYGQTFFIDRYSHSIVDDPAYISTVGSFAENEVNKLEAILARESQANAVMVGDEGTQKLEIVAQLASKIISGVILPSLKNKNIIVFNTSIFIAAVKAQSVFEETLIKILHQAENAGNVILVFDDFPLFVQGAEEIGSDAISIMKPFFNSRNLQIIATSNKEQFYRVFEKNAVLSQFFETIFVEETEQSTLVRLLEQRANILEIKNKVLFTYPAIKMVADGAQRYFPGSVVSDKAFDLLYELVPYVKQNNKKIIDRKQVNELIELKTNIKLGEVGEKEQEKLLKLEELLHRHIVGQDKAIEVISSAMRRSRTGINNPDKPIGSFLFLGPTGVGKTQTAKALAEVFFGDEDLIVRFDMSEYNTSDALDKLIGSFTSGTPGVLTSTLKEKPYGIVLLDELEKADRNVLDLFLQILDEGEFADAYGKTISVRNSIIIATSNAASTHIWEYFKKGKDVSLYKNELVDHIVKEGVFKPELLNRFDGIVVFHPLDTDQIRKIAVLILKKLQKRLKKKGLNFVITDAVIESVVTHGYNSKFGARPMNRAVQEKVEQVVAEKLIRGEIRKGDTVEFTESDLV